ncbi:MAG TPA: lysophospholipid acyltransferase family protein [Bryobacteraceae bacterium]
MFASIRAALITAPLIILATIVYGTVSLVTSLFDATGRAQHRVACAWARLLLRIGRVQVRVEGLEHLKPGGSYVFISNHLSYGDIPVVLPYIPVQFRFLAKKGLFQVPFIGSHLKRAGHIPVPRADARGSVRTMNEAATIVRDRGVSILVFPEGGRAPGAMRDFKEGPAYIAIKAGVPAVPMALIGTREVLPMGSLLVKPGRVFIRIGEPVPTAGMTLQDRHELTRRLQNSVAGLARDAYKNLH